MQLFHLLHHFYCATLRPFWGRVQEKRGVREITQLLGWLGKIGWRVIRVVGNLLLKMVDPLWDFARHLNWRTLREVFHRAGKQRLPGLSAEMAYNAVLALFPGLLALVAAIGLFESLQATLSQMAGLLGAVVPDEVQEMISSLIDEILRTRNPGVFSISFIGGIWIFSGVLGSAMAALDQIHQIPRRHVRPFWQAKLVAIGLAMGTLLLLIIASALVLISDVVVELLARQSCLLETIPNCPLEEITTCLMAPPVQNCLFKSQLLDTWQDLKWPITLGIVSTAFAFIYRFGPSRRPKKTPIIPGAVIAAIIWAVISSLFRLYVFHFGNYNWTYGTIGTFIILLWWLYLSSLAMLIGAQLNVTVGAAMKRDQRRRREHARQQQEIKFLLTQEKRMISTETLTENPSCDHQQQQDPEEGAGEKGKDTKPSQEPNS